MPISRFRQLPQPLDPTQYKYRPEEFVPDLSGLATVTAGLQKAYDASEQIPIPKHLQVDANDVQERYVKPLKSLRQQAVEDFSSGSLGDGIRNLKRMQSHIYEMKQPGGLYHQYEQNYSTAQQYNEQLDKLYEEGEISSEKRDALKSISMTQFPGTFDESGGFRAFEGITAAKDVALGEAALEAAKGWASDQIASGTLRRDPATGTYLYSTTREFVDFNEVKKGVKNVLMQNDKNMAFLRQAAELRGLKGEDATEFMNQQLDVAAEAAALKEGFIKDKTQFYRDWALEQGRQHEFERALERGEMTTAFFKAGIGGGELDVTKDGRVKIGIDIRRESPAMSSYLSSMGVSVPADKDVYASIPLDQIWEDNEEFRKKNPALGRVLDLIPRERSVEDNRLEPVTEYNKRVAEAYNQYIEDKNNTYIGFNSFTNAKQRQNANDIMFGAGEEPGEFGARSYIMMSPDKPPQVMNYKEVMRHIGASNMEEVRDRSSIMGTARPDNPVTPSGFIVAMSGKNKEITTFVASPDDVKSRNLTKPYYSLFQPKYNMDMEESYPQIINVGGENVLVKSKIHTYVDDNGNVQDQLMFFQGEPDEEGNVTWTPSSVTEAEMQEASISSNPFSPIRRK